MISVNDVSELLEHFAPLELAEDWDNVGLLVGDRSRPVERLMTCLTLTPASAAEAIDQRADLVVTHHPLPFRPLKRLTTDTTEGRLLLELIGGGVAIYSPHTAFDSAQYGINQHLATGLELTGIEPLRPAPLDDRALLGGTGRKGILPQQLSLKELAKRVKSFLAIEVVRIVESDRQFVRQIAVACGSGGSLLSLAREHGCDTVVTGEATFHACLEAQATGMALVLTGHFASERFAVEKLAGYLREQLPGVHAWASRRETDPLVSC